jgi:hypothetical protein
MKTAIFGERSMKFETRIATPDGIRTATSMAKEKILREGFTAVDIGSIVGIDMQDGSAIRISRESWNRLELFMALLPGVEMSISEERMQAILEKAKGS